MNNNDKLEIFKAQTTNVRYLEKVWNKLNSSLNTAYLKDDKEAIEIYTKLLIQIYCAYAEAIFSKILHTPYGLELNDIAQVKINSKKNIVEGWKKCFELSFKKVNAKRSNHHPNAIKKINELIDLYIYDPSLLRNKIAHGQWKVALNSDNTKINNDLTLKIESVNIVDLYRYKSAFKSLYKIIEDIIESPNKTHLKDYWKHITEFESLQQKMSQWTVEKKIEALKEKKSYDKTTSKPTYKMV